MRELIGCEAQKFTRRNRCAQGTQYRVIDRRVVKDIADAQKDFIGQHYAGDQFASGDLGMLCRGENRRYDIARMSAETARPVVGIRQLRIARGGAVDESRHVRRSLKSRADNGGAGGIWHLRGNIARDAAGFGKEPTHQSAQRIDDTRLGDIDGFGREVSVAKVARVMRQALLYAVDGFFRALWFRYSHANFLNCDKSVLEFEWRSFTVFRIIPGAYPHP